MNKEEIIELAQDLSIFEIWANEIISDDYTRYFTDSLEAYCQSEKCNLVASSSVSIVDGTAEYSIPSNCVTILGIFYKEAHLPYAERNELEAYDKEWKNLSGTPVVYTFEDVSTDKYRLVPEPDETGSYGTIIYTNSRTTDIMTTIGLHLAFDMVARDFILPSDHQDLKFAEVCKNISVLLRKIGAR